MKYLPLFLFLVAGRMAFGQQEIKLDEYNSIDAFGAVEVDLWLCVACRTCVRRCPGPEGGALELELKWSLPEVVKHITSTS